MDNNGSMNMRNWGFYEPTNGFRGHLGLHLMPSMADVKPLLGNRDHHHPGVMPPTSGGSYHHQPPIPMDYMRGTWINQRDKYLNILPGTHHHTHYTVIPEASTAQQPLQILHQPPSPKNEEDVSPIEENDPNKDGENNPLKKRVGSKTQKSPKPKKPKRAPKEDGDGNGVPSVRRARAPKRTAEVVVNGIDMDISGIPIPVCSCTGTRHQCYRWGSSGWQSACCTTSMSMYPLPMSTKRRSGRIAGRKMSLGAFKKVLEKLASESYNFADPIDLKSHWARHGTNKFVTIK